MKLFLIINKNTIKQETKKPLYKVLNEQRTSGNWEVASIEKGDEYALNVLAPIDYNGNKRVVMQGNPETAHLYFSEQAEANAQYTALAVNNVASLAEALQLQIDEWHSVDSNFHKEEPPSLKAAREALNRIS